MRTLFLLALVAFAAFCNCQDHPNKPCNTDADCNIHCPNSVGVCTPPTPDIQFHHCHCHAYGEFTCKIDADCIAQCAPQDGCCHNADHCHCNEICHNPHPHKH